ncbi:Chromosomal replication initiator protein DnaA [Sporomusa ovata DSM 2662]|uniref:Mobile element protein n=3 Tax=Sporomusa ovata TaxID=2378 RepID=A0A0U1KSW4_9FIRM|nr:IS21-like element helper ATPase IstB [Sporomusa ovata]EQB25349.1 insertion sequence IS21 putative ATP-binding protein [Sporomusa ovata DSM 2662]EQB26432.1 insertion sequence IS21 putative ATP-binding protein [Sporomusa ovata DSM 2662]CQR70516.1 Mobile element protein [Sporomusa ovata]CQR73912.1 Mobile element protein [Sporomusa ovata]
MSTKERRTAYKTIEEYAAYLRMSAIKQNFAEVIKNAELKDLSYEEFLLILLQKEWDKRQQSGQESRIRIAEFPYKKYLEDISVDDLPEDARKKFKTLTSLEFIQDGQNIILAGNPGTGKTHLAIGLGIKACIEGYRVLFTTVPLLVNQLKESRSQKILRAFGNKFAKYDLVIADELGYISFDKEGSELLFTHLSLRSGRKSTIITTNLSFERWSEIFHDPVMTAAMVDRLTHKSYLINMNGNSFRLKETKAWMQT